MWPLSFQICFNKCYDDLQHKCHLWSIIQKIRTYTHIIMWWDKENEKPIMFVVTLFCIRIVDDWTFNVYLNYTLDFPQKKRIFYIYGNKIKTIRLSFVVFWKRIFFFSIILTNLAKELTFIMNNIWTKYLIKNSKLSQCRITIRLLFFLLLLLI